MSGDLLGEKGPEDQLFTPPVNSLCESLLHILDPEIRDLLNHVVITYTFTHGYSDTEKKRRVCKRLLHMLTSDAGQEVLYYLCQYGAVTNLEIQRATKASRILVKYHLQTLEDLGLIKVYSNLENEPRLPAEYRNAKIRGWVGLPPEYSQRAIQRYLAFFALRQWDSDLEERGYEAIISKVHDGDVWESEAKAALEPLFPRGEDRIKFLDKINVRIFKSGIKLWRGK